MFQDIMAGLAALMTRKKRDRRRELELKQQMQEGPEVSGTLISFTLRASNYVAVSVVIQGLTMQSI